MPATARTEQAVREYAQLLLKMHELDPRGQTESPELDAICERLDDAWSDLGAGERQRVKGLSQDLYALADGRQGVSMSPDEKRRWGESGKAALLAGDPDAQLAHLRQPFPQNLPGGMIPFLQARCWERLNDPEVALVFMREAAKTLPTARVALLNYLQGLGRVGEAVELADRLIVDPESRPLDVYLAAGTLFLLTRRMDPASARRTYERIVAPLRRVLATERKIPLGYREAPELEASAAQVLAFAFHELGNPTGAVSVCTDALRNYPNDAGLLIARGLLNLERDPTAAEPDFLRAVNARARVAFPYVALAWFRIRQGRYPDVLALCNEALRFPGIPADVQALLFEWRGIALAMLGQSREWVEEEFGHALALDQASTERIEQNRRTALAVLASRQGTAAPSRSDWSITPPPRAWEYEARVAEGDLIPQALRKRVQSVDPTELMVTAGT